MPYLDAVPVPLPFANGSHSSYMGAVEAQKTAQGKQRRYLKVLAHHVDLTDDEASVLTDIRPSSICSTRNAVMKRGLVVANGHRMGRFKVNVRSYRLTTTVERQLWQAQQQGFESAPGSSDTPRVVDAQF